MRRSSDRTLFTLSKRTFDGATMFRHKLAVVSHTLIYLHIAHAINLPNRVRKKFNVGHSSGTVLTGNGATSNACKLHLDGSHD